MATKTSTVLIDDLDGGDADETVRFSLDGTNYQIDLSEKNAEEMRALLEPYMSNGQRLRRGESYAGAPAARPAAAPAPVRGGVAGRDHRAAIQDFARENDLKVPAERGRIAAEVLLAWEEAGRPGA